MALAGALILVPLGAVAATASAEAPTTEVSVAQSVADNLTAVAGPHDRGPQGPGPGRPGPGPQPGGPGPGPNPFPPPVQQHFPLPHTGSAG